MREGLRLGATRPGSGSTSRPPTPSRRSRPRPVAPDLILRSFDVPDVRRRPSGWSRWRTSAPGTPGYAGEQDNDPSQQHRLQDRRRTAARSSTRRSCRSSTADLSSTRGRPPASSLGGRRYRPASPSGRPGAARPAPRRTPRGPRLARHPRSPARLEHMVGRIPVMNVTPVVDLGRQPAKATVGEPFPVTATVFREGHDKLGAEVVLTDPDGARRAPVRMAKDAEVPDRYSAWVTPDAEGAWTFEVHAWSDPIAHLAARRRPQDPGRGRRRADVHRGPAAARAGARRRSPRRSTEREAALVRGGLAGAPPTPSARSQARLAAVQDPELAAVLRAPPAARAGRPSRAPTRRTPTGRARCTAAGTSSSRGPRARPATRRPARSPAGRSAPRPSGSTPSPRWASTSIYLPPIHPIGEVNRKGPNNTLTPGPRRHRLAVGDRQPRTAATTRSTPTSARSRTSTRSSPGPASSGSRSRSTSRCRPRPTTPG